MKHKLASITVNSVLVLIFISILNEMVIVYQETIVNRIWSSIILYTVIAVITLAIVIGFAIIVLTLTNAIIQDLKE